MRTFVLACGHCGIPEDLARASLGPEVVVIWRRSLCEDGGRLFPSLVDAGTAVIVLAGPNLDAQARIAEEAARAGVHPLRVRFLDGWRFFRGPEALEVHVRAAIARLGSIGDAERAATRETNRFRGAMPRRWFLNPFARYVEPMPRIEPSRCRAASGCDLCVRGCPEAAIGRGVPPSIDAAKCTSCGACLAACPTDAVENVALGFDALAAEAEALADGPGLNLAVACPHALLGPHGGRLALDPDRWRVLGIPSAAALRPVQILRLRSKGFHRVVGFTAGACCPASSDPFAVAAAFLDGLGLGGVVARWDTSRGAPPRERDLVGDTAPAVPVEDSLVAVARSLTRGRAVRVSLPGRGAGLVSIDRQACTLCGLCAPRCWSGALRMEEPEAGLVRLSFDHAACDGCGLCVDVCPERAVRVEHAVDTAAAGSRVVTAEDAWVLCASCGTPVAPRTMIARVARTLGPAAHLDLCPECKSSRLFATARAH